MRRSPLLRLVAIALVLLSAAGARAEVLLPDGLLPFDMPPLAELQASPRKVVAHWFLWPLSIDNRDPAGADKYAQVLNTDQKQWDSFLRLRPLPRPPRTGLRPLAHPGLGDTWLLEDAKADIRLAQAIGLDAFFVNFSSGGDTGNRWSSPKFLRLLRAAEELGTGFAIAPNLDLMTCKPTCDEDGRHPADRILREFTQGLRDAGLGLDSPALMRHEGRLVVGSFAAERASPEWWAALDAEFRRHGVDIFLMCLFNATRHAERIARYGAVCDAWSDWGVPLWTQAERDFGRVFPGVGDDLIVAPVRVQDYRARPTANLPEGFYVQGAENRGSRLLRGNWTSALTSGADWVQLLTWNDHGESSSFVPNTATQFGFYDLTAYYIVWYKTGRPPEIVRDALYYFHRVQRGPPWVRPFRNAPADEWVNEVEVVAFLTAPAEVEITTVDGTTRHRVGAGLQVVTAPMPARGRPAFRVVRDHRVVAEAMSPFEIGRPTGRAIDMVWRAGGSLRAARSAIEPGAGCAPRGADACLSPSLGEPVWLAR